MPLPPPIPPPFLCINPKELTLLNQSIQNRRIPPRRPFALQQEPPVRPGMHRALAEAARHVPARPERSRAGEEAAAADSSPTTRGRRRRGGGGVGRHVRVIYGDGCGIFVVRLSVRRERRGIAQQYKQTRNSYISRKK